MRRLIEDVWYRNHPLGWPLIPLSWLYCFAAGVRRAVYVHGPCTPVRVGSPVIVVGNISVGGTGKTPLVVWLVDWLQRRGLRPGVVSRGYGGQSARWPQWVRPDSDPRLVGDEPVLLAKRTGRPVSVGPDRVAAAGALLARSDCDIIVSDDGLQHYRLARDIEIAVVDGRRLNGNGRCLPAGPLREPVSRLRSVDLVITNNARGDSEIDMRLEMDGLRGVCDDRDRGELASLRGETVHAVCAIGDPRRFFAALEGHGIVLIEHAFPDHYPLGRDDIWFRDRRAVLMTEKDAVKCRAFAGAQHCYVPVHAELPRSLGDRLSALLEGLPRGSKTA